MRKRLYRISIFYLVALIAGLHPAAALAQQSVDSASLGGRVEDANGAIIKGTIVTAVNTEKNQSWVATSDEQGRYNFLYLPVGSYRLMAEHSGFQSITRDLTLSVGQALDLSLRLAVAGLSEKLSVNAGTPVVETIRTQVAETVRPQEVDSLPLNGRNYLDLAALTPAVTRANPVGNQRFAETSAVPGTQISVAGQRNINNGFVLDGLSANDDAADLPGTFYSQEVIREFQVITSGGIAEFGRASSGIINVITQSGTNDWRGRLYGFLRSRRTDARNPLASAKDPLTQGQYGASFGGPLRRDRTFLFANFEQTRLHNAAVLTISQANLDAINRVLDQLHYKGERLSTGLAPTGYHSNNFLIRGDHRLSPSHMLMMRYNLYDIESLNARGVGGLNAVSRGTGLSDRDHTIALTEIAALSPETANEARFQFTRSRLGAPPNDLTGPAVNISGVANFGTSTSSPTGRDLDLYEFVDNLTTLRGAHSLKFGGDFLYNRLNIAFPGALQGVYTFSSLANLQAGRYVTFQQAFGEPGLFQANPNLGFFVQDEWRAGPGLTVNLGLRYDAQFLPEPIQTDANNFAPRLGVAWSPADRKTVVRASFGIYFERLPLRATSNALQRDGSRYKVASFSFGQSGAPVFPSVASTFPAGFLPSITTIDPTIDNAYTQQASLQIEREISPHTSLSIGYLHSRGLHLILSRNVNVPTLPAAQAAALGIANLGRPNPDFANISRFESSADSYYNGLTLSLNRRLKGWLGGRLSYTYSKAIDNAGNAFFFTPQNNDNLRDDRGLSDNDQRHVLALSGTLALPQSTGDRGLRRALAGLQLSSIFRYGSALPFNIVTGGDRNNDTNVNDRPVGVGRNAGKGFDFASLDLRLSKSFRAQERLALEVLVESFNTLNRANFQLPNNTFGSAITPLASFGRPNAAADPRQIQFGLRVAF
jgi:hypothetical protein